MASLLCGIATSLFEMVLFRPLQGIFGAPLVPRSQAVLLDSYLKEKHGFAMALWGVGVMVGPILGSLRDAKGWRGPHGATGPAWVPGFRLPQAPE